MMLSHSGDDAAYYFMIVLQAFTSDAVPDAVKTIVDRMSLAPTELLVPILEAGQREGQVVAGDARQLAVLFFSLVQGLMLIAVERPGEFAKPDADSVLRLLKA